MNTTTHERIERIQRGLLLVGILAVVLSLLGFSSHRQQFFFSYLWSWIFWMGISTGSFLIVMIHHLTGGRWGYPTRRFLEAAFMGFPLMLVLFIPVLFGTADLYPWAQPEALAAEKVLQHRQAYMTLWPFAVRAGIVLVMLAGMAAFLRRWSLRQDATADAGPTRKARFLSGPGLVLTGLLLTMAFVDWLMSLESRWFSSLFAIVIMGGQVMAGFAFAVVMLTLFRGIEPFSLVLTRTHYHQLGSLLFTFVLFWAYVSFGQLLIIYSGDLPPELDWYLHRTNGNWKYLVDALALFHFFIPFFLLLFRVLKRHVVPLATIAALLLVMHLIEAYWLVVPSLHRDGIVLSWLDFSLPAGIGGLWLSLFLWRLNRAPMVPLHDPGLQFAFRYET